ncbi:hypothetical protein KQI65_10410 [bacterium]|nr:hypothetical protein [bacterium]
MLIIPALHIRKGRCTRTAEGEAGTEGKYPLHPADVARLWRGENAKALHVAGLDMPGEDRPKQISVLRAVVDAVDIPIQFSSAISGEDDIAAVLEEAGASRMVVPVAQLRDGLDLQNLLSRFGPRKIVVNLSFDGREIISGGSVTAQQFTDMAAAWKQQGLQRIVVTETSMQISLPGAFADFLHSLAERTNLSVTLNGSVREYKDLKLLQNLYPRKIDSIILDEALYSNAFPCQKIWRKAEQQLITQHKLL